MRPGTWRTSITVAIGVSLLLGLAGIGIGIWSIHKANDDTASLKASLKIVTTNDAVPATSVISPTSGETLSGSAGLDARPLGPSVKNIEFQISGGSYKNTRVCTTVGTLAGWLCQWDTTTVPNGTYEITSVGFDPDGRSSRSSSIVVHVANL